MTLGKVRSKSLVLKIVSLLTEALFSSCSLNGTTYLDCDLRKANFKEAKGYLIDVTRNLIKGAQFSYPEALTLLDSLGIIVD